MGSYESIGTIQPFLQLKEGVWADVYKAYDTSRDRYVLLKTLKSGFAHDEAIAKRFEQEAWLMASVDHPNVVQVLDAGHEGATVYFTAEYIEGLSLSALLEKRSLPPVVALHLLKQLALGLQAAHERGILHRDIKPANVLIGHDGSVRLADFGMASRPEESDNQELRGTMAYVAPELLFDGHPSEASDLFSLGATFFEMLTGRAAFRGSDTTALFDQILHADPLPRLRANPEIPESVLHVCETLLEKKPAQRYVNCSELIAALEALLETVPGYEGKEEMASVMADPEGYVGTHRLGPHPPISEKVDKLPVASSTLKRSRWVPAGVVLSVAALLLVLWFLPGNTVPEPQEVAAIPIQGDSLSAAEGFAEPDSSAVISETVVAAPPAVQTPLVERAVPQPTEPERSAVASDSSQADTVQVSPPLPEPIQHGTLSVSCTPYCEVMVDDAPVGQAPPLLELSLEPGLRRVRLEHPELPAYTTEVVIEPGKQDSLKIAMREQVGTITLNVLPWARVYIDDAFRGEVPPSRSFTLAPGEHALRLEHDDLGTWSTTVLVAAGEVKTQDFNLKALLEQP